MPANLGGTGRRRRLLEPDAAHLQQGNGCAGLIIAIAPQGQGALRLGLRFVEIPTLLGDLDRLCRQAATFRMSRSSSS
jgi:hypothetical protein